MSKTPSESSDETPVEEILDTIGDPYTRNVLAGICRESRSAQELADDMNYSLDTIYRRIEILEEHHLVKSQLNISPDGNHYQIFESNFNSALISVEEDEYSIRIFREGNLPDRFSGLWDELSQGTQ